MVMCSASEAVKETVDFLNKQGRKVGMVQILLYRPFSVEHFAAAIPATCREDRRAGPVQGDRLRGRARVPGRGRPP